MKATKKQIEAVTAEATKRNFSVEYALNTLNNCSKSIYDVIGAEGVVESSMNTHNANHVDVLQSVKYSNSNYISRTKNQ